MKHKIIIFACAIGIALPFSATAGVRISEVMYNPDGSDTGNEWIELYNDGNSTVALLGGSSGWKINDGSNHTLIDPVGGEGRGTLSIPAGGYMVLSNGPAAFMTAYGGTYTVIKSAISLNNTAATITLYNEEGESIDSVSYVKELGAADDGMSLHRSGTTFTAGTPSPGVGVSQATTPTITETSPLPTPTPVAPVGAIDVPPITVRMTVEKRATAGAGTSFSATALGTEGVPLQGARFSWNFGDGATGEGAKVLHTYSYPGRYAVLVTAAYNYQSGVARAVVEAIETDVSLLAQGDGSIILRNNAGASINIGLWKIVDGALSYTIPADTEILAREGVRFSSTVTGLPGSREVRAYYPNGALAIEAEVAEESPLRGERVIEDIFDVDEASSSVAEERPVPVVREIGEVAGAAVDTKVVETNATSSTPSSAGMSWVWVLFIGVLGVSAGGVYWLLRPREAETFGVVEGFTILERLDD